MQFEIPKQKHLQLPNGIMDRLVEFTCVSARPYRFMYIFNPPLHEQDATQGHFLSRGLTGFRDFLLLN